ncbi:MAG: Fe-S cluster assembly protein SufD [Bacteroidales bacterium]|nr:Fe-S cluster assembly protein SufD [Bacteroidales bacterium]
MKSTFMHDIAIDNLKALFNQLENEKQYQPDWLFHLRSRAFENFLIHKFPTKKDETYKYTSLEPHFSGKLTYLSQTKCSNINIDEVFKCDVPSLDTHLIILVNGWYYASSQQELLHETSDGLIYGSLREVTNKKPELIKPYFAQSSRTINNFLDDLNLSFMQDGLFVYIPPQARLEKPIQVINLVVADEAVQIYPRHLIISESSHLTQILFCDHSLNISPFVMNGTMEIYLKDNAKLSFYRMQNAHNHSIQLTNNYITQSHQSEFKSVYVTLHGGVVRNNIFVQINGEEAKNSMYGLWLADKNQHIDYFTHVNHNKPASESNQFFKGILDDEATGIFSGKIFVAKDAQKTNAYQSNKNLIISQNAKVRSKPQLEIYADDVKCSHGSATGKLDDDAMFYLRSRGISHKESCQLLMFAFASDITNQIDIDPLKEEIETLVDKRLRGELSRCNRCSISCT